MLRGGRRVKTGARWEPGAWSTVPGNEEPKNSCLDPKAKKIVRSRDTDKGGGGNSRTNSPQARRLE